MNETADSPRRACVAANKHCACAGLHRLACVAGEKTMHGDTTLAKPTELQQCKRPVSSLPSQM